MIKGLNHITIAVKDLPMSFQFYSQVLGFKPLLLHPKGAYFLAAEVWFCLDLNPQKRPTSLPEYTHLAFSVEQKDFERAKAKIRESGAQIWQDNKSEGDSVYFLDPDGHKLEIHVGSWESRIESYRERNDPRWLSIFRLKTTGTYSLQNKCSYRDWFYRSAQNLQTVCDLPKRTRLKCKDLEKLVGVGESLMSKVLRYRHQRFSTEKLLEMLAKIHPKHSFGFKSFLEAIVTA